MRGDFLTEIKFRVTLVLNNVQNGVQEVIT